MKQTFVAAWVFIPVMLFGWGDALAKQNRAEIVQLKRQLQAQQERIDGLVSLLEGMNETLAQLRRTQNTKNNEAQKALSARMESLEKRIDALEKIVATKPTHTFKRASSAQKPVSNREKLAAPKRYAKAVQAYKKRAYETAQKLFSQLVEEGYKPAASLFYLGEIAYYSHRYKEAIGYYKESAQRYDKAGYMDVLLLHTAVSLEKTGEKRKAKAFYKSLIDTYPGTKAARIAKKRLARLS